MKQYDEIIRETIKHNNGIIFDEPTYVMHELKRNNEMQKKAKLYETIR